MNVIESLKCVNGHGYTEASEADYKKFQGTFIIANYIEEASDNKACWLDEEKRIERIRGNNQAASNNDKLVAVKA